MSLVFTFVGHDGYRYLGGDRVVLDGHSVWGDSPKIFECYDCFGGAIGSQSDYFAFQEVLLWIEGDVTAFNLSAAVRACKDLSKAFEGMVILPDDGIGKVFLVDSYGSCIEKKQSVVAIGAPDTCVGYITGAMDWSTEKLDPKALAKAAYELTAKRETSVGHGLDLLRVSPL